MNLKISLFSLENLLNNKTMMIIVILLIQKKIIFFIKFIYFMYKMIYHFTTSLNP